MARCVLYADDMEPITVLELDRSVMRFLGERQYKYIRLPVPELFEVTPKPPEIPPISRIVAIRAEWFMRYGARHMFLFTGNEESAMLLKSAFLPGQYGELHERDRAAFARGFLYALQRLTARK